MKVLIIIGSPSNDVEMQQSRKWLTWLGIGNQTVATSARHTPRRVRDLLVNTAANSYGAVIAAASLAFSTCSNYPFRNVLMSGKTYLAPRVCTASANLTVP